MKEFLNSLFSAQNLPEGAREGLPYWIFWLLICFIVLLLAFIFLRDRDLRRRLDGFFAGIRKRLTKMRLQTLLKRERNKQETFFTDLGRNAWDNKIQIEAAESLFSELEHLRTQKKDLEGEKEKIEEKISALKATREEFHSQQEARHRELDSQKIPSSSRLDQEHVELKDIDGQIYQRKSEKQAIEKKLTLAEKVTREIKNQTGNLEDERVTAKESAEDRIKAFKSKKADLEKDLDDLMARKSELAQQVSQHKKELNTFASRIKKIEHADKEEGKKFSKEIKAWEREKEKILSKINDIDRDRIPLFNKLGRLINEKRIDHEKLTLYYSKIDRTVKRRQELENQIHSLD